MSTRRRAAALRYESGSTPRVTAAGRGLIAEKILEEAKKAGVPIREDKALKDVPIMAVTAYAAAADEERIRAAGAQAYVSKPISVAKFVAQVNELLGIEKAGERAPAPEAI